MPQGKQVWAAVKDNNIHFYDQNPQGSVDGLQGVQPFTLNGELTDGNGASVIETTAQEQPGMTQGGQQQA